MTDSFQIIVDKTQFLQLGRVFRSAFRGSAANVILMLADGKLRIEFYNGRCELACEHEFEAVAEMTAKRFSAIIGAYAKDKSSDERITLTFRPVLGEFATPLAGAKAKFHKVEKRHKVDSI